MAGQVPTDCEQKQLSVESSAMMLPEDEFSVQAVRLPPAVCALQKPNRHLDPVHMWMCRQG